jgi:hypothetical protein
MKPSGIFSKPVICSLVFLGLFLSSELVHAAPNQCVQFLQSLGQPEAAKVLPRYRETMAQIASAAKTVGDVEWSSRTGGCMIFPAKWMRPLQAKGIPVRIFGVQYNPVILAGAPEGTLHYFLVDTITNPGQEIIIDPTYKQFFKSDFPEPDIFIGTKEELQAVFVKYRNLISISYEITLNKTYDPVATAEVIYGFGRAGVTAAGAPTRADVTSVFVPQ